MKCQYLIRAPQGYIVVANITELALEANEDILAIFDGTNITDRRIRMFVPSFFQFCFKIVDTKSNWTIRILFTFKDCDKLILQYQRS